MPGKEQFSRQRGCWRAGESDLNRQGGVILQLVRREATEPRADVEWLSLSTPWP